MRLLADTPYLLIPMTYKKARATTTAAQRQQHNDSSTTTRARCQQQNSSARTPPPRAQGVAMPYTLTVFSSQPLQVEKLSEADADRRRLALMQARDLGSHLVASRRISRR